MGVVTPTKILNIARSQLNYVEGRDNDNKFGRWYGMNNVSWCDQFVSWVGAEADASHIIGRAAYTPAHAQWFKARGWWGTTPRRGAVVFYDFPDATHRIQHVGFVEDVLSRRIVAIEGNTSPGTGGSQANGNGVFRRIRSTKIIVGYGYPNYGREIKVSKASRALRSGPPPVTVDGVWGPSTTKALQRFLKVPADGDIGPQTRRALQTALRVKVDGSWGRVTRKALQKALGVKPDGDWGPATIKALQRRLNADWR